LLDAWYKYLRDRNRDRVNEAAEKYLHLGKKHFPRYQRRIEQGTSLHAHLHSANNHLVHVNNSNLFSQVEGSQWVYERTLYSHSHRLIGHKDCTKRELQLFALVGPDGNIIKVSSIQLSTVQY
jgi:hypothetical protein